MKTLLSILTEGEEKPTPKPETSSNILNDNIVALMSGRPSQEVKNLKGRAISNPGELLASVGVRNFTTFDSKIKNLESIFSQMIAAQNMPDDPPSQYFKNFFAQPENVKSPSGRAPGLLIKLQPDALTAVSKSGSAKRTLRIFAFWFASVVTAVNKTRENYFGIESNRFKFQYATGQNALLIFASNKPWKDL